MDKEFRDMVLDYMEKGFLDNIIDMMRHDENLFPLIVEMIRDERMRVRLGATALTEELVKTDRESLVRLIPDIGRLMQDDNPVVRGDGAYLLGIIGDGSALPFLREVGDDTDPNVSEIARDAIKDIEKRQENN